ncbi:MAG: chemotaxis protein CheW [Treponema sp.]|nr:chemotaxis protein CheW [Treponema sp.]
MELENTIAIAQTEAAENAVQEEKQGLAVVDFRMVTFELAGKDYAIDIMNIKEIIKADRFTYVPNTLPFVLGVYNLRGEIIPILDLRLFFNVEIPPENGNTLKNLIILTVGEQLFGVVIDKIDKVVGVSKNAVQPPHPLFGDINIKYISGVVEANRRLYVLLDIDRIFTTRVADAQMQKRIQQQATAYTAPIASRPADTGNRAPARPVSPVAAGQPKAATTQQAKADEERATNLKFIIGSLLTYKHFVVTPLNEQWVKVRFDEWVQERGKDRIQLQNEEDATAFLKPFWSRCTDTWWTKALADEIFKLLPDNSAKNIYVWNPGCGRGMETYSLACVLTKRYPQAKIKVYAQDIDLLSVSNAPLLTVPAEVAGEWLLPFLTTTVNGEYTFTQDIKNSIMFEYHNCTHTNALPMNDIIFARDVLSLIDESQQASVVSDFNEKLKDSGVLFLGEHEVLQPESGFMERSVGSLTAYNK